MKLRPALYLFWLLVALCPLIAHAADVQATLDRTRVTLGETVTLNLRVAGMGLAPPPDLGALSQDFAVLRSSSNTSIRIINGRRSAEVTVGVALRPLHVGTLTVPSLTFAGGTSQPLSLEVVAPDPQAANSGDKDVFLDAQVDTPTLYVGQQAIYTVRLYYATDLTNGALEDPQLVGVDLPRMGSETNYQAERGGRRYNVIERRYALTPQREGHLTIPSVAFQGDMVDMADPDSFFGHATTVSAASPPVSIDVRPPAIKGANTAWLPARELSLKLDGGPGQGVLRVGQPLNLVMSVQATGLAYEALPALSMPNLDGATVYPDKPVNGTRADGQWLLGSRQQGFAIVPSRPGTLTIPETTLHWWNVVTDKEEVATIPAQTFTVLPAIGAAPSDATPAATAAAPTTPAVTASAVPTVAAPAGSVGMPWRWIALGSLVLWVLSAALWWWSRRRPAAVAPTTPPQASSGQARAAFFVAARGGDAAAQAASLLAWARSERPLLHNLGELSEALAPGPQREAIDALQRKRYADGDAPPVGESLAAAFHDGFAWQAAGSVASTSPLPPLYPFKIER